jgi:hypothetical protein
MADSVETDHGCDQDDSGPEVAHLPVRSFKKWNRMVAGDFSHRAL